MGVDCNGMKEKENVERTRDLKHENDRVIICFFHGQSRDFMNSRERRDLIKLNPGWG